MPKFIVQGLLTACLGLGLLCASPAWAQKARAYVVTEQGDSLYQIAKALNPGGVSNAQVMCALYRFNPGAFREGRLFALLPAKRLEVPDVAAMKAEVPSLAAAFVRRQELAQRGKSHVPGLYTLNGQRAKRAKPTATVVPKAKANHKSGAKKKEQAAKLLTRKVAAAPVVTAASGRTHDPSNADKAQSESVNQAGDGDPRATTPAADVQPLSPQVSQKNDAPAESAQPALAASARTTRLRPVLYALLCLALLIVLVVSVRLCRKNKPKETAPSGVPTGVSKGTKSTNETAQAALKQESIDTLDAEAQNKAKAETATTEGVAKKKTKVVVNISTGADGTSVFRRRSRRPKPVAAVSAVQALAQVESIVRHAEKKAPHDEPDTSPGKTLLKLDGEAIRERINHISRELGILNADLPPLEQAEPGEKKTAGPDEDKTTGAETAAAKTTDAKTAGDKTAEIKNNAEAHESQTDETKTSTPKKV